MEKLGIAGHLRCLRVDDVPVHELHRHDAVKGGIRPGVFSTWVQTAALNFPMALLWQFFAAGPLARLIFREKKAKE